MENLDKKPKKGILKSSSSFDQPELAAKPAEIKFDEMNILQTLHPADKDYGFMKIDEPKTPFSYCEGSEEDPSAVQPIAHPLDPQSVAEKISARDRRLSIDDGAVGSSGDHDEEDDDSLTEEEKLRRVEFETKRKSHYNEFQAVKLARQLLREEEEDDEEHAATSGSSSGKEGTSSSATHDANGVTAMVEDTIADQI